MPPLSTPVAPAQAAKPVTGQHNEAVPLLNTPSSTTHKAKPAGAEASSPSAAGPQQARSLPAKHRGRTPVFVEVFCGLARLSKAARDAGFACAPVDHVAKASGIKVLQVDLRTRGGRSLLKGLLENADVLWVHWAPPCGTFSRAHEIRRKGAPLPLRNLQFIKGFRNLRKMTDRVRVRSANN